MLPVLGLVDDVKADKIMTLPVKLLMHSPVITAPTNAPISKLANIFVEDKIGAIPIVDEQDGSLVGIVSYIDLINTLCE